MDYVQFLMIIIYKIIRIESSKMWVLILYITSTELRYLILLNYITWSSFFGSLTDSRTTYTTCTSQTFPHKTVQSDLCRDRALRASPLAHSSNLGHRVPTSHIKIQTFIPLYNGYSCRYSSQRFYVSYTRWKPLLANFWRFHTDSQYKTSVLSRNSR